MMSVERPTNLGPTVGTSAFFAMLSEESFPHGSLAKYFVSYYKEKLNQKAFT